MQEEEDKLKSVVESYFPDWYVIDQCGCGYRDVAPLETVIDNLHDFINELKELLEDQIEDYHEHSPECSKDEQCCCGALRWIEKRNKALAIASKIKASCN